MAQTLTSLIIHIVFSTRHRVPIITPEIEPDLFNYMGGILKNNSSSLLAAGGTSDHVHLLVSQSKNLAVSVLLQDVKKDSSSWIKTNGDGFKDFHWQDGYGAFSISKSEVPGVKLYIANQKEHHRRQTFQEELIQLLEEYGIQYDERYLWN
jgi:REP element-mobilizing transposase RayT